MPLNISLPGISPKWTITGVLVLAVGLVGYSAVFGLNKRDAILHQNYQRAVRGQVISAGDIVAVPRGNRHVVESLCKFGVETQKVVFAKRYVNDLAEDLPGFLSLVARLTGKEGAEEVRLRSIREVSLQGYAVSLPGAAQPQIPQRCGTAISAALSAGQKVCVVAQAMLETSLVPVDPADPDRGFTLARETVGLVFRERAIVPPGEASRSCSGIAGFAPAVRLRHTLDVIREV